MKNSFASVGFYLFVSFAFWSCALVDTLIESEKMTYKYAVERIETLNAALKSCMERPSCPESKKKSLRKEIKELRKEWIQKGRNEAEKAKVFVE